MTKQKAFAFFDRVTENYCEKGLTYETDRRRPVTGWIAFVVEIITKRYPLQKKSSYSINKQIFCMCRTYPLSN
jgi:hypothetical protein